MGTTSEKLTYLNTTKEKIRDSINLTGANIGTSDTFRSYASKLKKGYIDIINNGIDTLYNNFPKVSGIGSNLSLTPTYEAPMKLNEIQGDTLQDGTPTPDSPVEIQSVTGLQNVEVCGKNLWSVGDKTDVGWASNYVDIKDLLNSLKEGTYSMTLNFKVTEIVKEKTNNQYGFAFYNSNRHITNKINTNSNINVDDNFVYTYTFTISSSQVGNFTNAYFYGFGNDTDNVTAKSLMYDCQLELGSSSTTYEPYKGNTYEVNLGNIKLNKISTYEDSIKKSTGKNLFDKDNTSITSGAYINSSTGEIISGGTSSVINNISIISNTTYTLTAVGKNKIAFYDSNNNYLSNITSNLTTFTTPSNCKYIKIQLATETLNVNIIQLEKGSTATAYEPYGKVWYIEKQIGKVVLDGSATENWTLNNNYTNNSRFTENNNILNKTIRDVYCNYFIKGTAGTDTPNIDINGSTGKIMITIPNSLATDTTTLITWLSTHNTEVLYVLNTPTITEITNTELIEDLETLYTAKSQEGTTNISITSEDLEMILNVSALKSE